MLSDPEITTIAHVIQLAIAPVFLLTGIGSLLAVMANRLGRIIDRARFVESIWSKLEDAARADAGREFSNLSHRAKLPGPVNANFTPAKLVLTGPCRAINLCAFAALLVCALIATLFIDALLGTNLRWLVGALFVFAMLALSTGMVCFLREVHVATHTLRIGPPSRSPAK